MDTTSCLGANQIAAPVNLAFGQYWLNPTPVPGALPPGLRPNSTLVWTCVASNSDRRSHNSDKLAHNSDSRPTVPQGQPAEPTTRQPEVLTSHRRITCVNSGDGWHRTATLLTVPKTTDGTKLLVLAPSSRSQALPGNELQQRLCLVKHFVFFVVCFFFVVYSSSSLSDALRLLPLFDTDLNREVAR
ncbi:MAG: hypothetical protein KatS3mg111_2755 [Pirellulaceae bacterium]|nr:MAG: hypothetical protein KatS3mg111_2755 [Pirellulaceae bacterium]